VLLVGGLTGLLDVTGQPVESRARTGPRQRTADRGLAESVAQRLIAAPLRGDGLALDATVDELAALEDLPKDLAQALVSSFLQRLDHAWQGPTPYPPLALGHALVTLARYLPYKWAGVEVIGDLIRRYVDETDRDLRLQLARLASHAGSDKVVYHIGNRINSAVDPEQRLFWLSTVRDLLSVGASVAFRPIRQMYDDLPPVAGTPAYSINKAGQVEGQLIRWQAQPLPVRLGASAPARVRPNTELIARFAAYGPDQQDAVIRELFGRGRHAVLDRSPHLRWKAGTEVSVQLAGRHIVCESPEQRFIWDDTPVVLEFPAIVSPDAPHGKSLLTFAVFVSVVCVTCVVLETHISAVPAGTARHTVLRNAPRSAFASYAHQDTARVLDMVSALQNAAGMDVWIDRLSLRAGQQWHKSLEEEIRSRELFILFWSLYAKRSEWVAREWRYALANKGSDAIQVQPLDPPSDELSPPLELAALHFNDVAVQVRRAHLSDPASHELSPSHSARRARRSARLRSLPP
jgi:hypothetical protein